MIQLDALPSAADFYARYWNRQPFMVRGGVPEDVISALISADELAGLALDDGPQSRMVRNADWTCTFGPLTEQDFTDAGEADWSLLVQNVEQFHPPTAALLPCFGFAPRWLMDDIMVSYSATGGSVGPHVDSYHVFLVQGQGRRRWTVGRQPIMRENYIEGLDLKILHEPIEGDEIEVRRGDVLYVPPKFGHEGISLEDSLTFSIGFLGPRMSDLMGAYGHYLSQREDTDRRYVGEDLPPASAGSVIDTITVEDIRDRLTRQLGSADFSRWLVGFFAEQSHPDMAQGEQREETLSADQLRAMLQQGAALIKPQQIKFTLAIAPSGEACLGFLGDSMALHSDLVPVAEKLIQGQPVANIDALEFLRRLYNLQVLEFI